MTSVRNSDPPTSEAADQLWKLSGDLMTVVDRSGVLLTVNDAWRLVLGWTETDLTVMNIFEILHPEDREVTRREVDRLAGGRRAEPFENRLRRADGEYRRISWRASPAHGVFYAVGRDITEQRRQEEALRHAQKMEAIGQLTGGIAHDFNNLLTIMRASVDFLKRPEISAERRERYVNAISEAVDRAGKVTGQLLAFARRQTLDPEVFDVRERIADVSELLRELVGPKIVISTRAPTEPCPVEADLCQFETVLMNLAINARDAMNGEGSLSIETRLVSSTPPIRGHTGTPGEFVAITVSDTGPGIPPEQAERIFDPFFTTKAVGKGTGLGLSQVYGFVRQSGGNIALTSAAGHGASFTIYMPRTRRAPARPEPRADRQVSIGQNGHHALLVEDNEEVGAFSSVLLRDLGYKAVWARNAQQALKLLRNPRLRFDVVLSDIVMPGMSGVELAEEVRLRAPGLPVILTSGYNPAFSHDGARGYRLLSKPYSLEELSCALEEALGVTSRAGE